MQPFSGNQRLTLNLSAEYVSCTAPATQNASLQILFKHLTPANFLKIAARPQRFAHFGRGAESHVPATPKHTQTPKSVREWCVLYILTSTCASRHNCVHFSNIGFQKCSRVIFCASRLRNLLRATTPCTFSTAQLPKVLRTRQFLKLWTSKCDSRHNCVHFFNIATPKSAPSMRCSEHFDFKVCFAPHRRAIFHLSSGQMAPHLPL